MRPLNFASQPFRNERLPALLFGTASVVLLAVTVHHALVLRALLPARTSKLHREVAALEGELDRLRAEGRTLTAPKPDKQAIEEWVVLKDLVDRRTFSWTGLFARLEKVLPREVRLVSIAPDVKQGQVVLDIMAVAQPASAGLGLVGLLEQRPEFEDVYPVNLNEGTGGGAEFSYKMRYLPGATPDDALASAEAAPAEAEAPTASAGPPPPAAGKERPFAALSAAPPAPVDRPAVPPVTTPPPAAPAPSRRAPPAALEQTPGQDSPPAEDTPDSGSSDARVLSRKPQERDH